MNRASTNPRLSIIVLTRNRLDVLRKCIGSILRQQFGEFEIVVLDDASSETDTAEAITREFADTRIRPYRTQFSLGVAGGRNHLMAESRGEIIVSIDDDAVFVKDNELDEVCRAFDNDPAIGIVAFKIMNVVHGMRTPLVPNGRLQIAANPGVVSERTLVSSFRGGGHAIRKCVIDELGGYRSDMMFGEEEMDLAYRVIRAGHHIAYEPSIEVDHFPMPSTVNSGCKRTELFYHVRNRAYLAYRYLPLKYAFSYLGIWAAEYAWVGIRNRQIPIRGALATPDFLRGVKREALDRNALAYLTEHGGRLWY